MKRKLLCLLLCISMILPNVPMAVHADEAATCEHMEVSEDGTVSGNGVCEICAANEKVDAEEKEETDQKEDGNVQSEEKRDSEQSENEKIVSIENEDAGKSDTQETKKQQDSESGQTSQENKKQVSGNAVEEEKKEEGGISSNNANEQNSVSENEVNDSNISLNEGKEVKTNVMTLSFEHEGLGSVNDVVPKRLRMVRSLLAGNVWDDTSNLYYGQLDDNSKAIYDILKNAYQQGVKMEPIALNLDRELTNIPQEGITETNKQQISSEISGEIGNIVNYALLALLYDHPEMSWLVNTGGKTSYSINSTTSAGKTTYCLTNVVYTLGSGSNTNYTKNQLDTAINKSLEEINEKLSVTQGTNYDKIKAIHDYICETVSYVPKGGNLSEDKYQTVHSALLESEGVTVCAGYAKAFKVLCNQYGIPCILVSGQGNGNNGWEAHMWNYVKLNGSWYAVDCTWDDQNSVLYDFFLVGRNTKASNSNDVTFDGSHQASGQWSNDIASPGFAYPVLSTEAYAQSSDATALDTVYVSVSGTDLSSGEETAPVKSLEKALEKVKEGGIIVIKDSYTSAYADVGNDEPFIINKAVTIQGGSFSNSHAGIILGADVVFKNIELGFSNTVRNAIIANGHTLTLDGVTSTGANGINLFCGDITQEQDAYNAPNAGNDGRIILKGMNNLKNENEKGGDIYAGNFSDLGTTENNQNPTVASTFTGDATICIERGASGNIGNVYVYGAREDRDIVDYDTDMITGNGIEENYKITGDVTIELYGSLVKKVSGASDKVAHVVYNSDSLIGNITFSNIDTLEVNGKLQPADLDNGINIILNSGSRLDLSALSGGDYTANNLMGVLDDTTPGILVMSENYTSGSYVPGTLTVEGAIRGKTEFRTNYLESQNKSGIVTENHPYILGNSQNNGEEFVFNPYDSPAQENIKLLYSEGKWIATAEGEVQKEKPTNFSIDDEYKTISVTKSVINKSGVTFPVNATFTSENSFFYDVPLKVTVSYGSQTVGAQEREGAYYVDSYKMEIYAAHNDQDIICIYNYNGDISAATYKIAVSVETTAGTKTETITLTVTDDTQVQVPDAEFNPPLATNGWYRGLSLNAPNGYKIASAENGNYDSYIEVGNGEYTNYSYWLKNDINDLKVQKNIANLKVDDTVPTIISREVTDITSKTARINVKATDELSGLTDTSYKLGIASESNGNDPIIETFSGTKDGGYFEISGMTANETYVFNLIVGDVAGNEAVEEVTIVAGKNNLSSGQLSVKNGTTYTYNGTELKPGADQLVLTINGQPILLNDADYTYTYSNNINAGRNAQVTVTATDSNTAYSGAITGTFTIGSRPITITPKPQTIRNGNQIQMGVNQVDITDHVSGHTLEAITLSQDNTKKKIEASEAVIKDTTQNNVTSNYQIIYNEGNLTIVDPVITVQVNSNIVYDGNPLVVGDSGTQNDVTYTLKDCSTPDIKWYTSNASGTKGQELPSKPKDAGNYIVEIRATVDNNLGTEITEKQVTIKKATLTATVENKSLTYGESFTTIKDNAISYSGFVNQETASVISGTPKYSSNYTTFGKVGNYTINADMSNVVAANYEFKVVPGSLDVNPREVTLTWSNYQNRTYGDGKRVTATISNLVNDDKVTVVVSGADATEVGTHTATATGLRGEKAANYTLGTRNTQNYTIAKATAPTNVTAQRNVKWSKAGTETFAVADFSLPVNVKNPKITKVTKNMGETVDDQRIFANNSQVVNGQVSLYLNNPSIYKEGQKGVFEVTITSDTHKDITAKLILNIIDREVVDSNLALSVANVTYGQMPEPKGSFSGSKASNVTEVYQYSTDGITYQTLDSLKNSSGFLPAGDYSVQYSYTDDEQIGTKTEAFRVEKKELNISFDVEAVIKEYDGTTTVPSDKLPTLIIKEAVGSEQPKLVNTGVQFTYDSIQAGEGKTIQVTGLSLDTSESVNDNYTVQSTVSSVGAIITPKKATVLPKTAYTKQYGEKEPVLEYKVTGLIGQDTLEGVLKRAAGENVGSYSYDISGLKNQNYKVELDASSSKFEITKAEAQLTLETDLVAQKASGKVMLTATAKSKKELQVMGVTQPTAVVLAGVSFTEREAGVFEGIYTIPENAKVGDKITVTVSLKDANYEEVTAKTVIQVIEEELKPLPTPQEKPETEGAKKPSYKLAMEKGISKVPDGLKKLGHLDTVEEIRDALKLEIKKLHSEITDATSAIYDVTLWYHPGDDDSVWQKADKTHWSKSGKITVVLPYPEGTGKNTHNFKVTHMFTVEMNNNKPGTFEYPTVTKTEEGISFQVSGLSPITLGWTKIKEASTPAPGNNSQNQSGEQSSSSESSSATTSVSPQEVKKEEVKKEEANTPIIVKKTENPKSPKVTVTKEKREVVENTGKESEGEENKVETSQKQEEAPVKGTENPQQEAQGESTSGQEENSVQREAEKEKSSWGLWIALLIAIGAVGTVFFILWKNKKEERP